MSGEREICFDTETTGLDASGGDRIIDVGCVELQDRVPTGKEFQTLLNPQRPVSEATVRITGLTDGKLKDQPIFADKVDELLDFLGEARIIAHNADFDRSFLNAELERCGRAPCPAGRFEDTLILARGSFPGQGNSLDALCRRFGIGLEGRQLHGALKDARLLAGVYMELRGGRERLLDLSLSGKGEVSGKEAVRREARVRPEPLASRLGAEEIELHRRFLEEFVPGSFWGVLSGEV